MLRTRLVLLSLICFLQANPSHAGQETAAPSRHHVNPWHSSQNMANGFARHNVVNHGNVASTKIGESLSGIDSSFINNAIANLTAVFQKHLSSIMEAFGKIASGIPR